MNTAKQRCMNSRLLDSAYFAGGMLADKDVAAGRVRRAIEVIEKVMTQATAEIDTVAAALAGYYERLGSAEGSAGLSLAATKANPAWLAGCSHIRPARTTSPRPFYAFGDDNGQLPCTKLRGVRPALSATSPASSPQRWRLQSRRTNTAGAAAHFT